jgi:hypothetical protein
LPPRPTTGNGLVTMRERAEELGGTLAISSDRDGTCVTATLPLSAGPPVAVQSVPAVPTVGSVPALGPVNVVRPVPAARVDAGGGA